MAGETDVIRNSETIHITVLRCRHLRGVKGDALTSYVHIEFDSKALGDSQKVKERKLVTVDEKNAIS